MMFGAPDTVPSDTARIPSIVILGADALLAALPATPIQLAHACMRIGYQHVVPASWGDELIAAATLRELHNRSQAPAIHCSCPFVANRLLAVGTDLRPFLVSLVAPPVVLARYLRRGYGSRKVRLTYVGRCPGAADEAIDARLTPEELLATFADHQIEIELQPEVFDSVIPPDRRRFRSQPGGLPAPEMLWLANANSGTARTLVELYGDELPVELAQHLLAGKPVLIDVAAKLGCVCSGATGEGDAAHARARVAALEPPRATSPIVDESAPIDALLALPASPRNAVDVIAPPPAESVPADTEAPSTPNAAPSITSARDEPSRPEPQVNTAVVSAALARRFSPARGIARLMTGGPPTARDADGRQLPRTYVARRRSSSRPTNKAIDTEAPIPLTRESAMNNGPAIAPAPNENNGGPARGESSNGPQPAATPSPLAATTIATAPVGEQRDIAPRPADRPLPPSTAARPDLRPRTNAVEPAPAERPVMQLMTLGLLITMVVLISAAIGLVVGRWMTQH